jgi:hypothetical protein
MDTLKAVITWRNVREHTDRPAVSRESMSIREAIATHRVRLREDRIRYNGR